MDFSALPATTPVILRQLLARCLDRNPKTRLQHIGEARIALDKAVAGGPADVAAPAVPSPTWRQPLAWALVAIVAAATFAATSWLRQPDATTAAPVVRFSMALPFGAAAQGGAASRGAVTAGSLVGDLVDFTNPTNREIAISPLGTDLAFEWKQNLCVRRLNEEQSMRLAEGFNDVRAPFFSPNGRYIGFFALEKVWRVPVAGGPAEEIGGPIPGRPFGVEWAHDGRIYVGVGGHIARLPENGGSLETVVQVKENEAAADPHGGRVAVVQPAERESDVGPGTNRGRVTQDARTPRVGGGRAVGPRHSKWPPAVRRRWHALRPGLRHRSPGGDVGSGETG